MTQSTFLESVSIRVLALPTSELVSVLERFWLELHARAESVAAEHIRRAMMELGANETRRALTADLPPADV